MCWRTKSIAIFTSGTLCGVLWQGSSSHPTVNAEFLRSAAPGSSPGSQRGIGCNADIAPPGGDGMVNVNDLLAVINNWGPCVDDDQDNDGWSVAEGDCDDANPNVHPGAAEVCNNDDDDCDGDVDEGAADSGGNTCATPTELGFLAGDSCGGASILRTDPIAPPGDNDFYHVRVEENSSATQDLYARVTLIPPSNSPSPLSLCVSCNSCGNPQTVCINVNPGQVGTLIVRATDVPFGGDNSFDLYVQVKSVVSSQSICADYELTINCTPGAANLTCN